MCGIVGIASKHVNQERTWLKKGMDAIVHRGPDDSGEWWSEDVRVGLGFRRLAILDLSNAGHQPMFHPTGNITIIFNGEIYNYKDLKRELQGKGYHFNSQSDTEVVLHAYHAWGEACVSRLQGMFAFAIADTERNQVFVARDRAGEKPLFYYYDHQTLVFASELKALFCNDKLPRKLDIENLNAFLSIGYVPGDQCIIEGFNKLPPAHALSFQLDTGLLKTWPYWKIPEFDNNNPDEGELLTELDQLLRDAVKRQMVADVPVGVLLSGGVDSSLITAMAAQCHSNVKTFTISFPGFGKYDETAHARLIANHFGTDHTELVAEATTVDLLPKLAAQFDEPIIDSSIIPTYLVSHLVRQYCTVALGGDGGDELFGGYSSYTHLLRLRDKIGMIPTAVRSMVAVGAENLAPVGLRGRNLLMGTDIDFRKNLNYRSSFFDRTTRKKLVHNTAYFSLKPENLRSNRVPLQKDLIQRATRMDFQNYLPEDILVKVDRASMINSLEIRAPFLDINLVEFAFRKVPSDLKATVSDKKILLKKLSHQLLPPEFDRNRKQGFSIPLSEWLKDEKWQKTVEETLLSPNQILFDKSYLEKLIRNQARGYSNSERIFALMLFEMWRNTYQITIEN